MPVHLLWSKIFVPGIPPLTDDNFFSEYFPTHCVSQWKHAASVGPTVYHLFAFRCFSPSWPLLSCTASLTMCTLITSKNLLLSPLSFVLFPLFLRSSPVSKMLKSFFTLCCFSFSLALELTPAFPCAPLYTSSVWTTPLSHTYPKNPNSSALFLFQWVLLRVRDFFVVGMCLL